ncbi:hypothetical protein Xen7305DRAFT_00028000 [Xenococcus sp. PCC 7305]|uniref:hypothetical protein n=1 Tax=Xenococcus sp. PCC 7305 TaxID=102125 RepID=UPI0002ACACC9|nr:hypothetical protein [Xenococcus sp. PCC 7305]ELS03081.1 hypothetical protein Xen7305DRAFT_00028000 [Xenococcus sp. PCC 7305]
MYSHPNRDRSRFVVNQPFTLPASIPSDCQESVIFSLKTHSIYDEKIYLWSPKKAEFMLNLLFRWDEIDHIFSTIEKSRIYHSDKAELYCFTLLRSYIEQFDHVIEAIVHGRLFLDITVEKANSIIPTQMNYLTIYNYLEKVQVHELMT